MQIFIGSDHGGFAQKVAVISALQDAHFEVKDCGTYTAESTDYPDFAVAVGNAVRENPDARGILLCRSGEGMEMAANKIPGIRAALVWKAEVAQESRHDNDANVLVLPSDYISNSDAVAISQVFLKTPFSGESRHVRRIEKLHTIERIEK